MKKSFILISTLTGLFVLSGCTQQVASANPNDATMVASDTVTLDRTSDGDGTYSTENAGAYGKGNNSVHFAYDSNKLSQKERSKIIRDATVLRGKSEIKVEGNSDEFGTDEYNYALGLRRAKAVKDTMVAKGIPAKKIKLVSYGESNPECTDKTQKCYQENRRADYK